MEINLNNYNHTTDAIDFTQLSDDETYRHNHDLIESIIELERELTLQQSSPISESESQISQDYTAYHYNHHHYSHQEGFYININNTCIKEDQPYLDTSVNSSSSSSSRCSSSRSSSSNSSDKSLDLSEPAASGPGSGASRSQGMCVPDLSTYAYDLAGIDIPGETTEQIARRIKEFLIENKISQRVLAESLLNMKQANLSPLLSAPKPWQNLTPIIRNRFLVMHMWLNDTDRLQKLHPTTANNTTSSR